ncbi:lymphocyte cytosolic protein 2 [Erinaceus europaeus]|uniref:Lymphocyte cytosolic protein 2 n=1 Tax=Erinaceus europaeus TaxID=9365 RepID=A0ABM3WV09_ERIEU|nr:lymphocyte cytosolic protein 2 [Erinaceus europaeus]
MMSSRGEKWGPRSRLPHLQWRDRQGGCLVQGWACRTPEFTSLPGCRILSKLSQEINKNDERRSIFTRKPQVHRFLEDTEPHAEDNGGWSSFEEDDYESPNEDQDVEDGGDYESPDEEEEVPFLEEDADYEPPPSNDEEAMQGSILPAKSSSNAMYIDRPPSGKGPQQPPVPPQRPMVGAPPPPAVRSHLPPPPAQPNHEEPSRSRTPKPAKLPAPSIDRSTKPPLDRSLAPLDREPFILGKKPPHSDKPLAPAGRPFGDLLPKIPKPPLPPTSERHERSSPLAGKKPPVSRPGWGGDRRGNDEGDVHQRPLPQPALPSTSSSTFPSRSTKPASKYPLPAAHMPGAFLESNSNFQQSASLPPYFSQGSGSRPPSRGEGRNFSLPVPSKPRPPSPGERENSLSEEWYVSYITRPEAEAALRKINQDGTFLVRDSSKKTISNPYVLMVLYKDKVYNIQIRYQEDSQVYLLGTGLRGKEVSASTHPSLALLSPRLSTGLHRWKPTLAF